MKLKIKYVFLMGLFVSVLGMSCKTTGGTTTDSLVEDTVPPDLSGPVDETSLEALAQAQAQAEESRSWAEYVRGETYFPQEWEFAEDRYSTAKSRTDPPETKAETYSRVAEWKGIGAAYDDIFNKSAEQFALEQEKALAAAREAAVSAGAGELVPDRLAQADEAAASAKKKYQEGDLTGSVRAGKDAWDRYRVLETIARAHTKQQEADQYDFFSLDSDNYMIAADAGNDAVDQYDAGNLVQAQDSADESLARFNQVVKNGWIATVEEKASAARQWREASLAVKANVAVKGDYDAAERIYNQAHVAFRADEYTSAVELFEQSGQLFMAVHATAQEKRSLAEEALLEAEQKLQESEAKAQSAEAIIGGGE
ncbi:MAG: hypothetical protein LBO65_08205 [Spirochaetaceae bacterium]|jgi:hypothetical protein|nr:hypothetical protein [Spirochaetaceae bacterium]